MKKLFLIPLMIVLVIVLVFGGCAQPAPAPTPTPTPIPVAEPIVLKAVTFLPTFVAGAQGMKWLTERVNERSGGELIIDWLGGGEVIGMFSQPPAVSKGTMDIVLVPASIYQDMVPEAYVLFLSPHLPSEERESGLYDWMAEVHEKANMYLLGRAATNVPFWMWLTKPVETPSDLKSLRIGAHAFNVTFAKAVATAVDVEEYYTAMERGVIDGSIDPASEAAHLGYWEVVKYVIDYPLYAAADTVIVVNLDKWNSLPPHLQKLMTDVMIEAENELHDFRGQAEVEGMRTMLDEGVQPIRFSPEDAKWFTDLTTDCVWDYYKGIVSPESYDKMKKFLEK